MLRLVHQPAYFYCSPSFLPIVARTAASWQVACTTTRSSHYSTTNDSTPKRSTPNDSTTTDSTINDSTTNNSATTNSSPYEPLPESPRSAPREISKKTRHEKKQKSLQSLANLQAQFKQQQHSQSTAPSSSTPQDNVNMNMNMNANSTGQSSTLSSPSSSPSASSASPSSSSPLSPSSSSSSPSPSPSSSSSPPPSSSPPAQTRQPYQRPRSLPQWTAAPSTPLQALDHEIDPSHLRPHLHSFYSKGQNTWVEIAETMAARSSAAELASELRLLLYVMMDSGDLSGCGSVLDFMAAKHIPFPDPTLCDLLLAHAVRVQDVQFATWLLSILAASNSASDAMFSKVASLQYQVKDFSGCISTYSAMRTSGHNLSFNDLRALVTAYAHLGDVNGFASAAANLKDQHNNLFTLTSLKLAGLLSERGATMENIQLLAHTEALLRPDHRLYITLLHMAAKTDSNERFYEILEEMKSAGIPPNVSVFNSLRASLERTGRATPDNLGRMAEVMQAHDIVPATPRTESKPQETIISPPASSLPPNPPPSPKLATASNKDIKDAIVIIESRGVRAGLEELAHRGTAADLAGYNTILDDLAKKERAQECRELLQEMAARGVRADTNSYNYAIFASKHLRLDDYRRLMEEMKERGIALDLQTYSGFLSLLGKRKHWTEYDRVLLELRESDLPMSPAALNIIMNYAGARGDLKACQEAAAELTTLGGTLNASAYNSLITAACAQGNTSQAAQYLYDMKSNRITPDVVAYNRTMQAFAKKGLGKECGRLLEEMKLEGVRPNSESYVTVLKTLLSQPSNNSKDMVSLTWEMCNWILADMEGQKITPGELMFVPIADYLAKTGSIELFNQICEKMKKYGLGPDSQMYTLLVERLSSAGNFEQAISAISEMRTSGLKPSAVLYSSVLRHLLDAEKWEEAENVVKDIREAGEDGELSSLCEKIVQAGKHGDSVERNKLLSGLQNKTVL